MVNVNYEFLNLIIAYLGLFSIIRSIMHERRGNRNRHKVHINGKTIYVKI